MFARRRRYDSVASCSIDSDVDAADVNEIWQDFRANGRDSDLDGATPVTTLARELFGGESTGSCSVVMLSILRTFLATFRPSRQPVTYLLL